MRDALKSYLALASGLTDISKQRAVTAAKALVAQGEATAEQVSSLAEDLVQQSRSNREAVTALVAYLYEDLGVTRVFGMLHPDNPASAMTKPPGIRSSISTCAHTSGRLKPLCRNGLGVVAGTSSSSPQLQAC